jgi:hypothetical protein
MLTNRITNYLTMSVHHLKDQMQIPLNAQQKKVAAIALAIFTAVILCYAAYRTCLCLSSEIEEEDDDAFDIPKPKISYDILKETKDHFKNDQACKEYVNILFTTGFVYDPYIYLERWKTQSSITNGSPGDEVRQYLEKKLKFEQNAYNFLDKQKIIDDTDALRKIIEDRFKPQGSIEGLSWIDRALRHDASGEFSFAIDVLDTGILIDPKGYLEQWEKERGGSEEFRIPEDTIRHFFEKQLLH